MEQIQYIEDSSRYQRKEWADEMVQIKPKFVSQLKHQVRDDVGRPMDGGGLKTSSGKTGR